MNLPCLGSHLAIWLLGSKAARVISCTDWRSLRAFSALMMGANEDSMKWILGKGTRLVSNSFMSTLSCPENLTLAVMEEMTWQMSLFRLEYVGLATSRFLLQMP